MTDLQIFRNPEFGTITTAVIDSKDYFAATECARLLGYANPEEAIREHCKGVSETLTIKKPVISHGKDTGHTRDIPVKFISEGNLFRLIARSNLPEAERFEQWIFDEVLPSIRRNGSFAVDSQKIESLQTRLQLAEQKLQLFEEYNEDILYDFDQVATAMRIYRKPPFGASHLKRWLADQKIICSAHYKNDKPNQAYIERDWFRLVMHEWKRRGVRRYEPRYLITQRGFNGMIDLAIREHVISLPLPKDYCLPYLQEKLSPEVGGEVVVNDPYGAGEIAVEMAVSPLADTGMPVHHRNGDEPIDY